MVPAENLPPEIGLRRCPTASPWPGHLPLSFNDNPVPGYILATLLEREQREGTLSFLYQLISLRPCFGAFFSELVETVRQ